MTETKLSERLIKSSKKLLNTNLKECSFANFLLTGDAENGNDIIIHMWKNLSDLRDSLFLLFESALKKADTDEERRILEEIMKQFQTEFKIRDSQLRQKFGSKSEVLLSSLMARNFWLFHQFLITQASIGSFNDMLAVLFSLFWVKHEVTKLNTNPAFKPNKYYDFWCDYNVAPVMNAFAALINAKQSTIACDERKHMIELFRKLIAYGHMCFCGANVIENLCLNK